MNFLPIDLMLNALSPAGRRGRLSILIYHRVLAEPDLFAPWGASAEVFECQMAVLHRYFNVIPLAEAVERLSSGSLPTRVACVTFDDGYRDNLTIALPILKKYAIPATVFVASSFLDGGRMWNDTVAEAVRRAGGDRLDLGGLGLGCHSLDDENARVQVFSRLLQQIKYLPHAERAAVADRIAAQVGEELPGDLMMTGEEVRELSAAGIDIGGHTLTHPILSGLDDRAAKEEIAENKAYLSDLINTPVRVFAYPNGRPGRDYNAAHVRMVKECGYLGAVSTATGAATRLSDPYQLPRFTPWDTAPSRFALRLARNLMSRNSASMAEYP